MRFRPCILALLLATVWLEGASAQSLKVLSLEMGVTRDALQDLAEEIRAEDPDIILAQSARGWAACAALAEQLKPSSYNLLTCSGFGPAVAGRLPRETAILAKQSGYYAWSERIDTNFPAAGFSLAVIRAGTQQVAVVSAQLSRATQTVEVVKAALNHIELLRGWKANRPTSFVFMSSGKVSAPRVQSDVRNAFAAEGFERAANAGADRLAYAFPPGAAARVKETPTNHNFLAITFEPGKVPPVVKEVGSIARTGVVAMADAIAASPTNLVLKEGVVEKDTPNTLKGGHQTADTLKGGHRTDTPKGGQRTGYLLAAGGVLGGITLFAFGLWLRRAARRQSARRLRLLAEKSGAQEMSYVVVAPVSTTASGERNAPPMFSARVLQAENPGPIRTESAAAMEPVREGEAVEARAGLVEWLKGEFVRRIVRDRSALMREQEAAIVEAQTAARRIEQIQEKIHEQNRSYERRIEELEVELGAAREENRELIRARIQQIRADMEAARVRLLGREEG